MNKAVYVSGVLLVLSLGACSKQTESAQTVRHVQAQLGQAKHFDVPVPVSFKPIDVSTKKQADHISDFMKYSGTLSVAQTIAFYKQEMEAAGWDIANLSTEQEGFLYCSKPTKYCGIEVRSNGQSSHSATTLCLFITQQQGA